MKLSGLAEQVKGVGHWCEERWIGLAHRDRRMLGFATPIILMLALYLVLVEPIVARYSEIRAERDRLGEALVWLYEQAELVDRTQNSCRRQRLVRPGRDQDLGAFATSIAKSQGQRPTVRVLGAHSLSVNLENAPGSAVLRLLEAYACHGFTLDQLELVRATPDSPRVIVDVRLAAADFVRSTTR